MMASEPIRWIHPCRHYWRRREEFYVLKWFGCRPCRLKWRDALWGPPNTVPSKAENEPQ